MYSETSIQFLQEEQKLESKVKNATWENADFFLIQVVLVKITLQIDYQTICLRWKNGGSYKF